MNRHVIKARGDPSSKYGLNHEQFDKDMISHQAKQMIKDSVKLSILLTFHLAGLSPADSADVFRSIVGDWIKDGHELY